MSVGIAVSHNVVMQMRKKILSCPAVRAGINVRICGVSIVHFESENICGLC